VSRAVEYLIVFAAGFAVGVLTALMLVDAGIRAHRRRGGYLP
jgi:hypothetical protein